MARTRRLSLRAALALAAVVMEQEQAEILAGPCFDEEWAPFGDDEAQPFFLPMPGGKEGGEDDEAADEGADEEQPMLFSHFTRFEDKQPVYVRGFSNVQDFCTQPFANKANEELFLREEDGGKFRDWGTTDLRDDDTMPSSLKSNESWYGARSPKEAMDRALHGWPEGAQKVRDMMGTLEAPAPVDLRRRAQRADQGDELDIHAVYRGGLDRAWTRRRRQNTRARMSIRVVVPLGGSRMMHADEMFWRGAAAVKLSELLEESGYRVEIVATNWHEVDKWLFDAAKEGGTVIQSFIMKDAGAPLDVEAVAGVVCNAGFFRTFGFRDAYAAAEHAWRDTVYEPIYAKTPGGLVKRDAKGDRVKTGRSKRKTLLSRAYNGGGGQEVVDKLALDADGTLTIATGTSVGSHDGAQEWVRDAIKMVEAGVAEKLEQD